MKYHFYNLEQAVLQDDQKAVKRILGREDFTNEELDDILRNVTQHRDEAFVQKYTQIFTEAKLANAIASDDYTALSNALAAHIYTQDDINKAFVYATNFGNQSIIELLFKRKADINAHEGQALINAIGAANKPLISFLLEHGADVTARNSECLTIAIREKQIDLALILIEKGANPALNSPLIPAVSLGDLELCKLLIEKGAHPATGQSQALINASQDGYVKLVELFLAKGAYVSAQFDSPLIEAARYGHYEVVKVLIKNGANAKTQDSMALTFAAQNGHTDIVKLLVDNGASLSIKTLYDAARNGHLEIIKFLASTGMKVADKDNEALRRAAENGHLEIVKYLKEKGKLDLDSDASLIPSALKRKHLHILSYIESTGSRVYLSRSDEVFFEGYKTLENTYLSFVNPLVHSFDLSTVNALLPAKNMHVALEMIYCMRASGYPDDITNVLTCILIKKDFNPEDFFVMPKTIPLSLPTEFEVDKFSRHYSTATRRWLALISNNQEANPPTPQQHM